METSNLRGSTVLVTGAGSGIGRELALLAARRGVERGAGGHVVNLSSMAGFFASPSLAAYSTTKFAVLGLSEALREELRPYGIGVTAICPGMINTPITRNAPARGLLADPAARERVVALYRRRNYGADRVASNI